MSPSSGPTLYAGIGHRPLSTLVDGLFIYLPLCSLTRALCHCVLSVTLMTIYNSYSAYMRAEASGRKNIKFISLKPTAYVGNPVTRDTGMGSVDSQRGDF